jgi:hypothetical protein
VEREALGVRRSAPAAKAAPSAAASRAEGAAPGGPLREELRRFERCEGEAVRRVETAGDGRIVRYVREGTFDGRRLRVIQTFRPDGTPAAATAQDLDTGAPVDPRALGLALVAHARDAGIDAPPRCGR